MRLLSIYHKNNKYPQKLNKPTSNNHKSHTVGIEGSRIEQRSEEPAEDCLFGTETTAQMRTTALLQKRGVVDVVVKEAVVLVTVVRRIERENPRERVCEHNTWFSELQHMRDPPT